MSAGLFGSPVSGSGYVGLKTNVPKLLPAKDSISWTQKTVSNGSRTHCMKVYSDQSKISGNCSTSDLMNLADF